MYSISVIAVGEHGSSQESEHVQVFIRAGMYNRFLQV